jgi:hypothetical protein
MTMKKEAKAMSAITERLEMPRRKHSRRSGGTACARGAMGCVARIAALVALVAWPGMARSADPTPVRMMALGTGFPFLITSAWKEEGFEQKYGFALQVKEIGNLSGQWNAMRSGEFDLILGNFLDVIRQHKAGLKMQAFQFSYNYSDPIVTTAAKPYRKISDLRKSSVGVTRVTNLPVLLYRVAGRKAYGFDLIADTTIAEASPSLLPEMLRTGKLDATYSLHSLVFSDVADGKMRIITDLQQVLADAKWDVALTLFVLSDSWRAKYGEDATRKLARAFADLNQVLRTKDAGWDAYANAAKIAPEHRPAFKITFRKLLEPNFGPQNLGPMQQILDAMVAVAGESIVGAAKVDPAAFDYRSMK